MSKLARFLLLMGLIFFLISLFTGLPADRIIAVLFFLTGLVVLRIDDLGKKWSKHD